jgi:hypothetical protein
VKAEEDRRIIYQGEKKRKKLLSDKRTKELHKMFIFVKKIKEVHMKFTLKGTQD